MSSASEGKSDHPVGDTGRGWALANPDEREKGGGDEGNGGGGGVRDRSRRRRASYLFKQRVSGREWDVRREEREIYQNIDRRLRSSRISQVERKKR